MSLTARLAIGFVSLLAAAHIAICMYLDYTLQAELLSEDQRQLAGMTELVRGILQESTSLGAFQADRRLLEIEALHADMQFVVRDAGGNMAESSYDARWLIDAAASGPTALQTPYVGLRSLRQGPHVWRVLLSEAVLGDAHNTSFAVAVSKDVSERDALAARYRARLGLAAIVAVAAAVAIGLLLLRRALAPLASMARRAGAISASRLDERLPILGVPRELHGFAAAFNQTLERLQDSFRRLSQFSSDLAHDLRTPIGNLMGEAQVALRRVRTAQEYQAVLASALEEYERINRMIDGMLFLARADNAHTAVRPVLLRAAKEVQRVADFYEGLVAERGLMVQVQGAADIVADSELFRRAIANLLSNAIEYTSSGGLISIRVANDPAGGARVEVENPGPGIPPDVLARIFDRFYRGDASRGGSQRGAGLGLAIVHSIMQLHGGSATVETSHEGPTVFTLMFPPGTAFQARV